MGDRAVAGFRSKSGESEKTIYLYQHWSGEGQIEYFSNALLNAMPRWTDASYATRIMVSHLVGDQWTSETGFGLYVGGTSHGADYAYILIADFQAQAVLVCDNNDSDYEIASIPFDEFIQNAGVLVADLTMDFCKEKDDEFMKKYGLDKVISTSL